MKRLPFLDDLRFFCTVLMVAYHAGASFTAQPAPLWPVHDVRGTLTFDFVVLILRWSRMPIVFFVSGLSAGILFEKSGTAGFFRNRLRRIYLPMIAAGFFIYPSIQFIYHLAGKTETTLLDILPAHLWFLIYLLPMYLLPPLFTESFGPGARRAVRRIVQSSISPLVLSFVTFGLIYNMDNWLTLEQAIHTILPKLNLWLYYALFFMLGWAVSFERDLFSEFGKNRTTQSLYLLFAAVSLMISLIFLRKNELTGHGKFSLLLLFTNNLFSWVSLFFWIGVFVSISPTIHRYLKTVNASAYWVFLAHYPLVLLFQWALHDAPLNAYLKFAITLLGTLALCVGTWWLWQAGKPRIPSQMPTKNSTPAI